LAAEVSALDQVRRRLLQKDAAGALASLREYRSRFPSGRLASEAAVLRIQALVESDRRAAALELGTKFMESRPDDPLADRVRALLGRDAPAERQ
jgi:outer membrane protein assembly factor BamD (BamD/ComL family)